MKNNSKNNSFINFWPYVIVVMLILGTVAAIWTVKIAVKNPVQDANIFLGDYHQIDENINDILIKNIEFYSKYDLKYDLSKVENNQLNLKLEVLNKEKSINEVQNIEFKILLTRPETQQFDRYLELESSENGIFSFKTENIQKDGRWVLYISASSKVANQELRGLKTLFIDTSRSENSFEETDIFHTKNKRFN